VKTRFTSEKRGRTREQDNQLDQRSSNRDLLHYHLRHHLGAGVLLWRRHEAGPVLAGTTNVCGNLRACAGGDHHLRSIQHTAQARDTKAFWVAFFVAWGVSTFVLLVNSVFITNTLLSPVLVVIGVVVVAPVAFVISMTYSRIPAVRNYLFSLIRLRGVWGWALLALVLVPALILLSIPVSNLLGGQGISDLHFPELSPALLGLIAVKFFYRLFFFNATGEEVGWRGFALPRLQAFTSPLIASLVLTFFWGPWHFFPWQAEGRPVLTWQYWIESYFLAHFLITLIFVWICNRAKGNILVAGITHAAMNTAFAFIPLQNGQGVNLTLLVAALVMILVDRMWKKLPPDHPAVYQTRGLGEKNNVELSQQ